MTCGRCPGTHLTRWASAKCKGAVAGGGRRVGPAGEDQKIPAKMTASALKENCVTVDLGCHLKGLRQHECRIKMPAFQGRRKASAEKDKRMTAIQREEDGLRCRDRRGGSSRPFRGDQAETAGSRTLCRSCCWRRGRKWAPISCPVRRPRPVGTGCPAARLAQHGRTDQDRGERGQLLPPRVGRARCVSRTGRCRP